MMHEYRTYNDPYRPSLRARVGSWFSDKTLALHGHFWEWFFDEIDWRRVFRRFLALMFAVLAGYVLWLAFEAITVIVAITYGVWPR